jgi:hypothetical protein
VPLFSPKKEKQLSDGHPQASGPSAGLRQATGSAHLHTTYSEEKNMIWGIPLDAPGKEAVFFCSRRVMGLPDLMVPREDEMLRRSVVWAC